MSKPARDEKMFTNELGIYNKHRDFQYNEDSFNELKSAHERLANDYKKLLEQTRFLTWISGRLEKKLYKSNKELAARNSKLEKTVDELISARAGKNAYAIIYFIAIILFARDVPDAITGGQSSVGLRAPSHPVSRALLAAFGGGIAAPSANRFGHVSPTTARHVADDLGDAVDLILDGGPCDVGIESTIVAFTDDAPMLLRPGGVPIEAIAAVLGRMPLARDATAPRASGTLSSHYAPRTPASLVAADALVAELSQLEERDERVAVLAITARRPESFDGLWIGAPDDAADYARLLYANLRTLDATDADAILIEQVPQKGEWSAIGDRLARATTGEADDRD